MRRFLKKDIISCTLLIFLELLMSVIQKVYELPLSCGKERDHRDYDVFTDAIFSFQLHIFK